MSSILADGHCAIVTAKARADDVGMIDANRRAPCRYRMTILAIVGGGDMRGVLAGRRHAVMTAGASSSDVCMAKVSGRPCRGGVTVIAGITALQVTSILSGGHCAIMTTKAGADDVGMIDAPFRRPGIDRMAILAIIVGVKVSGGLAGFNGAVMATDAVAGHAIVTECGLGPSGRHMAIVAGGGSGDMVGILAAGRCAIMAAGASANDCGVIDA